MYSYAAVRPYKYSHGSFLFYNLYLIPGMLLPKSTSTGYVGLHALYMLICICKPL